MQQLLGKRQAPILQQRVHLEQGALHAAACSLGGSASAAAAPAAPQVGLARLAGLWPVPALIEPLDCGPQRMQQQRGHPGPASQHCSIEGGSRRRRPSAPAILLGRLTGDLPPRQLWSPLGARALRASRTSSPR